MCGIAHVIIDCKAGENGMLTGPSILDREVK